MPPLKLAGVALLVGSVFGLRRLPEWRLRPAVLLLGVYGLLGYHFVFFQALRRAPPVEANLVNDLWPLLIILMTPLFQPGRRLGLRHAAAGLLGFSGAALLVTGGRWAFSAEHLPGYAFALAAAFVWTTYSLALTRLAHVPTGAVGAFCAASGALALLLHAWLEPAHSFTRAELPAALAMGLGPLGWAFYAWDDAMKRGDPRVVGALSYLIPLVSTLLLAAFAGGRLDATVWAAMALVIGGSWLGAAKPGAS